MNSLLLAGAALLIPFTADPANAAHKHATRYRQAPVQHLVPRLNGGVQQPTMLNSLDLHWPLLEYYAADADYPQPAAAGDAELVRNWSAAKARLRRGTCIKIKPLFQPRCQTAIAHGHRPDKLPAQVTADTENI